MAYVKCNNQSQRRIKSQKENVHYSQSMYWEKQDSYRKTSTTFLFSYVQGTHKEMTWKQRNHCCKSPRISQSTVRGKDKRERKHIWPKLSTEVCKNILLGSFHKKGKSVFCINPDLYSALLSIVSWQGSVSYFSLLMAMKAMNMC